MRQKLKHFLENTSLTEWVAGEFLSCEARMPLRTLLRDRKGALLLQLQPQSNSASTAAGSAERSHLAYFLSRHIEGKKAWHECVVQALLRSPLLPSPRCLGPERYRPRPSDAIPRGRERMGLLSARGESALRPIREARPGAPRAPRWRSG